MATKSPRNVDALPRLAGLVLLAAMAFTPALAQNNAVPPSLPTTPAAALNPLKSQLQGSNLDQKTQAAVQANLDAADAQNAQAADLEAQTTALGEAMNAPEPDPVPPLTAVERQAQLLQWQARLPANPDPNVLEELLAQEHTAVARLRENIDTYSAQLASQLSQPGQIVDTQAQLRDKVAATAGDPPTADGESPALYESQRVLLTAQHRRAVAELALSEAQQDGAGLQQRQLEAKLQSMRRELSLREPRIAWLQQRSAQVAEQQLRSQAASLQTQADALQSKGGVLASIATDNAKLGGQLLLETQALAADRDALDKFEQANQQVASMLRDTQARLNLSGGASVGQWLWQQRISTPSKHSLELRHNDLQNQLSKLRLARYELEGRRRAIANVVVPQGASQADVALLAQLQAREEMLFNQLDAVLDRRIDAMQRAVQVLADLGRRGTELRTLMDRELLWVPSHSPINGAWLKQLPTALVDGFRNTHVGNLLQLLGKDIKSRLLAYLLILLVFAGLSWLRWSATKQLAAIAKDTQNVYRDRFGLTVQAFMWTLLISLPLPVTLWLLGKLISGLGAGQIGNIEALGRTLVEMSALGWVLALLRALLVPNGLAEAHLRWPQERLHNLRWAWRFTAALLIPTAFLGLWAMLRQADQAVSVHARLAVIVMSAGLALLVWRTLRRAKLWPSLSAGVTRVLDALLALPFLAVAVLAVRGYIYSGVELLNALLGSVTVLLLVQVIYTLLMRWLLLSERALALKKLRQDKGVVDVESGHAPEAATNELELVSVSAQSRRLLQLLRLGLLVAGLIAAWSGVLPALLRFDEIALWHFTSKSATGEKVSEAVTLLDVVTGVLLLFITASLARNLPGLIEMLFSSSKHVGSSLRYTVSTLLRYGVVIIGTVVAFSLFGVRWSQLQWMAAALTVGLGFGLQEIFANFVSGLILLVERPFRVGDIITVDSVSGTVTRIRTRATTVQDFDNKELIIPNKTFITGQVVNWTLSDAVTRLTIPVGVAYGSPVDDVHALLMRAAKEHPRVLADPKPRTWFVAFGDSTLNFELRVFVATTGDRVSTRSELLSHINDLFAENNIDIAFPQMDVHVRDLPERPPPATPASTPTTPPPADPAAPAST